jgi:hypothetical protein
MVRVNELITFVFLFYVIFISGLSCAKAPSAVSSDIPGFNEAQQNVTFKIVIPSHIAEDAKAYIQVTTTEVGLMSWTNAKGEPIDLTNGVEYPPPPPGIRLMYQTEDLTRRIIIHEDSGDVIYVSSDNDNVLFVGTTRILEDKDEIPFGESIQTWLNYRWSKNGVRYEVLIYGYNLEQSRRIVESMIKQ